MSSMNKLVTILLLAAFVLPACEKKKNDIEIPLPSEPPNLENFKNPGPPQ